MKEHVKVNIRHRNRMPLVKIPERELWVYKNKKVLQSLEREVIQDAKEGRVNKLDLSNLPKSA